jgi:hypothetical protein
MPIGKSGKYHMNPHEMRRKGDAPDEKPGSSDEPVHGKTEDGGDGQHHHTIHMHEDGTAHSEHTHPDGSKEEPVEHGSYEEAKDHMDSMMGHEEPEADETGMSSDNDGDEDMAGMYGACL